MQLKLVDAGNPKDRLRKLRNALALEAPRAQVRSQVPPELGERLQTTLRLVSGVYLAASSANDHDYEQLLRDGERVLSDWGEWLETEKQQQKPVRSSLLNQRQHERFETNLSVRILRHGARDDIRGDLPVDSADVQRQARNISLGGIFVNLPKSDLPEIVAGSMVHVSVGPLPGVASAVGMRATVARRDGSGLGLRWVVDSPRTQRLIDLMLDAIQKNR